MRIVGSFVQVWTFLGDLCDLTYSVEMKPKSIVPANRGESARTDVDERLSTW